MIVQNGRILTMAGKIYENGFVEIKGKKIERVGSGNPFDNASSRDDVIDAEGGWARKATIAMKPQSRLRHI